MAMRSPRGGISGIRATAAAGGRQVFRRPVSEDFRPFSEWKHVEGADVLLIHLPGFVKENLKITSEPGDMIKVRGERMLANNTWSRFSQDFRIPENCSVAGISARFEGGILYITMAKNPTMPRVATNDETQSPETTTETPKSSEETRYAEDSAWVQPEKVFESKRAEKTVMEPKPESSTAVFKQKSDDFVEEVKSKVHERAEDVKTSVAKSNAQKAEQDQTKPGNNTENTTTFKQKTTNLAEEVKSKLQKSAEDMKTGVAKPSAQKPEQDQTKPENMTTFKQKTTNLAEEVKSKLQKSAEEVNTGVAKSIAQKNEQDHTQTNDKEKESSNSTEKQDAEECITQPGEDQLEKYKQVVADFAMKVKDDRETVVNIGAAVLVLVSLGVYISYTTFGNV